MTDFDPLTISRFQFLANVTADDYAAAVLDLNETLAADVLAAADLSEGTAMRARLARKHTRLTFDAIARILSMIVTTEERRENLVFLLAKAIDDSLNLGAFYMAGRPKEDLPPPITAEQIAREMASRGGKSSVKKRRAKLKEGWHKHALEKALEIRAESPSMAQKPLATEIGERWRAEGFKPGFDALLNFIRACEANGSITRRTV